MFVVYISLHIASFKHKAVTKEVPIYLRLYVFYLKASPAKDKQVFLVENYPRYYDRLPDNLLVVEHRTRDIMFCDKTLHNKQLSKAITYYLEFIDELYHVIEDRFDLENVQDKEKFEKIKAKYKKISDEHRA
jgi:NTE family protein